MKRLLLTGLTGFSLFLAANAQLAITEAFPSASTNGTPTLHGDWWELTNFGASPVDVSGYRFNDSNGGLTNGIVAIDSLILEPGESVIFLEQGDTTGQPTAADFLVWWGPSLPSTLRIFTYSTTNIGLSSSGDSIRLWDPTTLNENDPVARAGFGAATNGVSFTYNPTTGLFAEPSVAGVGGAFAATDNGDLGSPGITTGPVPLAITLQPASAAVNPLATAVFAVAANGLPRPQYRWQFNEIEIPGATLETLTITNVDVTKTGAYRVLLSNGLTTLLSDAVQLTLVEQPTPPTFTQKPVDTTNFLGGTATLSAVATGVPPPTYQWYFKDGLLPGETGGTLVRSNLTANDAGEYRVTATNPSGSTNAFARLTVRAKPDLRITEVESSEALDADFVTVYGFSKQDWWELTSFESVPVSLFGWRFDDNSASLVNAYTITNDVTLSPGESIVLVEVLSPQQFRTWWGPTNVPENVKIISYSGSGLGLSSGGDSVRVWDATTTSDADTVAAADFGPAEAGISFNYDPDTGVFGAKSVLDTFGVFAAEASAGGGQDLGSPGRIRAGELPPLAPVVTIVFESDQFFIDFIGQAGRTYHLEGRSDLVNDLWNTLGLPQTPTVDGPLRFGRPSLPGMTAQYFRVVVE